MSAYSPVQDDADSAAIREPLNSGRRSNCSAIVLAGGDGVRLRTFTRACLGCDIPKQFIPVSGSETLLGLTLRRVSLLAPASRTITVLNRDHRPFFPSLLAQKGPHKLLVQPGNRGTAPAILSAIMRLTGRGQDGPVAIFPSDHYVSDDDLFMQQLAAAVKSVELHPGLILLIGVTPRWADSQYGWIEPGADLNFFESPCLPIARIARFCEKPAPETARRLLASGCLWNTGIVIANASALEALFVRALPELYATLAGALRSFEHGQEDQALEAAYSALPPSDFSFRVLSRFAGDLTVLRVIGLEWSDLGDEERLLSALRRKADPPAWLANLQTRLSRREQ